MTFGEVLFGCQEFQFGVDVFAARGEGPSAEEDPIVDTLIGTRRSEAEFADYCSRRAAAEAHAALLRTYE